MFRLRSNTELKLTNPTTAPASVMLPVPVLVEVSRTLS
jgi:hypothetical protein